MVRTSVRAKTIEATGNFFDVPGHVVEHVRGESLRGYRRKVEHVPPAVVALNPLQENAEKRKYQD